jgi:pSer/pThr/pTyr-binding forkhead associated (FHA) protein/type II secretory pathway predicted ATPase ExeA
MDLGAAGLKEQPFRTHGRPLSTVRYASFDHAIEVLNETRSARDGLALLQGPSLSGKTTILRAFFDTLPEESSVAIVDGNGLNKTSLFEIILRQFGYEFEHSSPNELLGLLRVFAQQQAVAEEPPIIIIENAHGLNPSAMRALCELASIQKRHGSALKLIVVSDRALKRLISSPEMESLSKRITHDFHLRPMSNEEAIRYLHAKLRAAGSEIPEFVFPVAVCTELWRSSGGWPGILDRLALLTLAKAQTLPLSVERIEQPVLPQGTWDEADIQEAEFQAGADPAPPTLYVSRDGQTLRELSLDQPRLLIGRSEHNDIAIPSKFISRHHALLVRHGSATFLMDLNSTNGTFVNSRRVSNHVLIHDDVISLGHHRIKFRDPHATQRGSLDGTEFADTAIMKTLQDMRALLAQENTAILPVPTENLPTSGL